MQPFHLTTPSYEQDVELAYAEWKLWCAVAEAFRTPHHNWYETCKGLCWAVQQLSDAELETNTLHKRATSRLKSLKPYFNMERRSMYWWPARGDGRKTPYHTIRARVAHRMAIQAERDYIALAQQSEATPTHGTNAAYGNNISNIASSPCLKNP